MEINQLPFEHKTSDLSRGIMQDLQIDLMTPTEMGHYVHERLAKGIKTHEQLMHATGSQTHGGGFEILLSFLATDNVFFQALPDPEIRHALFMSSEEFISRHRVIGAGIRLGVIEGDNLDHQLKHGIDVSEKVRVFQEKLLQRVTPSDPMMRR